MRDLLVEIPNHPDNKLNAAYQIGGIPLLYETIEHNFDLKIDGYCLVGFDDFESIIDLLGGIDISLTSAEANYLRKTNYISNPSIVATIIKSVRPLAEPEPIASSPNKRILITSSSCLISPSLAPN